MNKNLGSIRHLKGNVTFNHDLYKAYRRLRYPDPADSKAIFFGELPDTTPPLHCFALDREKGGKPLGKNGQITDHELQDVWVENTQTGKRYQIDSICVHFLNGYYYHATMRMEGTQSHGTRFIGNINSNYDSIIEGVAEFENTYKILGKTYKEQV